MFKNNLYSFFILAFFLFVFLLGLVLYSTGKIKTFAGFLNADLIEEITGGGPLSCPNVLIRKGGVIILYNTTLPTQDGVNPLVFTTLDDYVKYYNDQVAAGNSCEALLLQEETTAQGQTGFRVYPNFNGTLGNGYVPPIGSLANPLPVRIDRTKPIAYEDALTNPPINMFADASFNMMGNGGRGYTPFDPQGQYVGRYTNLDQIHDSTHTLFPDGSPNAADDNWGGVLFTEEKVASGYYDDNNVMILTG